MAGYECFTGKHTGSSDNLALLLRLGHTLETAQKQFSSVNNRQVNAEMLLKSLLDLLAFIETHHPCGGVCQYPAPSPWNSDMARLPLSTRMAWKRSPGYNSASQVRPNEPYGHTDCLFHELGCDGRIYTPRNGSDDLCAIANEVSDANNFLLDEIFHHPAGLRPTDVDGEVAQDLTAAWCLQ